MKLQTKLTLGVCEASGGKLSTFRKTSRANDAMELHDSVTARRKTKKRRYGDESENRNELRQKRNSTLFRKTENKHNVHW